MHTAPRSTADVSNSDYVRMTTPRKKRPVIRTARRGLTRRTVSPVPSQRRGGLPACPGVGRVRPPRCGSGVFPEPCHPGGAALRAVGIGYRSRTSRLSSWGQDGNLPRSAPGAPTLPCSPVRCRDPSAAEVDMRPREDQGTCSVQWPQTCGVKNGLWTQFR